MSVPEVYYLFVYGSLRSGFKSPAYDYISQYFDLVSDGKVKGELYDMGDYPAAIPTQAENWINGELYIARNKNEFGYAIGQLDDYEGVLVESHERQLYRRELASVSTNNQEVVAWIYWFNGDTSGRRRILSGDIIEYVKRGSGKAE